MKRFFIFEDEENEIGTVLYWTEFCHGKSRVQVTPLRVTRAGIPTAREQDGIWLVTTDRKPITELSPTEEPFKIADSAPSHT